MDATTGAAYAGLRRAFELSRVGKKMVQKVLDSIPTVRYTSQTTEIQHGPNREFRHESKKRLLDAALQVIRAKGYTATRIEDICETTGLT